LKRRIFVMSVLLLLISTAVLSRDYISEEQGISITIPEEWKISQEHGMLTAEPVEGDTFCFYEFYGDMDFYRALAQYYMTIEVLYEEFEPVSEPSKCEINGLLCHRVASRVYIDGEEWFFDTIFIETGLYTGALTIAEASSAEKRYAEIHKGIIQSIKKIE